MLFKNTLYSTINSVLRFLSTALLYIILARALGVEEFGRFTFALSFTGIFLTFIDYGFNLLVVKEISQKPESLIKWVKSIINAKILLTIIFTIILFIALKVLKYPDETIFIVFILWLSAIFYSFGFFFNNVFRGLNQFQYETYPTILLNAVQFIVVSLFLILGFKTISVAIAYLLARILYFVYSSFLLTSKVSKIPFVFNLNEGLKSLKIALPYGIHAILATLYFQIDTVFLSYFKGNVEVGYYQAAMRILMATMIICEVIVSAYFPIIAEKIKTNNESFKRNGLAFNKYMILTGGIISAFLFLFSEQIIPLIYGKQYENTILIMQLLSIVVFLRFLGASYAVFITVTDNQMLRAIGVAASVVLNVGLNIILIPRYGAIGAAIVSIITHLVLDSIYTVFATRLTKNVFLDHHLMKGLLTIILAIFICVLLRQIMPLFSIFVFMLFTFSLFLIALSSRERESIKNLWNRLMLREAKV